MGGINNELAQKRYLWGCLFFLFLGLAFLPIESNAYTTSITFDEFSFAEGTEVTNQYASRGVIFSGVDGGPNPIIAIEYNGDAYAYYYGKYPNKKGDYIDPDSDPPSCVGGKMLTDGLGSDPNAFLRPNDIKISFSVSATEAVTYVKFYLLDVDAGETFHVKAYNYRNTTTPVVEKEIETGDPNTGDGIATEVILETDTSTPIDYIIITYTPPSTGYIGFAIDCLEFRVEESIPVPEPATVFLLGIGLLGVVGIGKKKGLF